MKHFYLLLVAVFFSIQFHAQNAPLIMTFEVDYCCMPVTLVTIDNNYIYNYSIDFGDGTVVNNVTGNISHVFTAGLHTISITGDFPKFRPADNFSYRIISVDQWGDIQWQSMKETFMSCTNLLINATDAPDLSQVTDMSKMFQSATSFNSSINHWDVSNVENMSDMFRNANLFNQPLNNWNVSNVTNMSGMFSSALSFNQPIDNWDVSSVTDMSLLLNNSTNFNQPLGNWDVSNVIDMKDMFRLATSFNQPLDNWDVSSVTNMSRMFRAAFSFNQPLNNWDVSSVTDMSGMFFSLIFNQPLDNWDVSNVTNMAGMLVSSAFNQPLNTWDVSNVTNMNSMFFEAQSFNQPLDNWDVSNVTTMGGMFRDAISFNQPLDTWDVSNVTNMTGLFVKALAFNQPLNNWDVSNVTNMREMFSEATAFNQPLDNWDVSNVTNLRYMFDKAQSFNQDISSWQIITGYLYDFLSNTGMDMNNYDSFLTQLATLGINNGKLGVLNLEYCNTGARDYLINQLGWNISGDSLSPDCHNIQGTIMYDENKDGCDPNDINVDGFMIVANDGTNDWISYSNNGSYNLGLFGTNFTVSVVNQPNYFTVTPASIPVTFTTSPTEIVDFCVTANQSIEDLNITLLPTSEGRPGFEADYRLVIKNVGTETIANVVATLEFDDSMQQFVVANPVPGTTTTNTLTFPIGTMQPFQNIEIDITMLTFQPPTVNGDDVLNFIAEVTPSTNDHTPNDNIYNLAQVVVNSYDPNDKQVLQGEELHIDDVNEYLDYLIRFQNMGTASAINVRILDTLHPKLDWSTLQPISASHNYYVKIADGNRVEFMFDNIHLPHEAANEPASHGFVAFKIKLKNNVQVGDVITGDAAIYFDFNAPIITNMVQTQIVEPLSLADNQNPLNQITVYPNPTNKTLHLFLTDNIQLEEVSIYDLQGKEVQKFQGKGKTLNVENLSRGMYFLRITTDSGVVNRKLVKE